ncbi:carbohydrate kinase family protein [Actinocrinis puniceicyclus]|uniref:Carbohydrate kinase family protein n=1 Tax=Actinocrinis puniceicyclus TaxID=977794 RepID=A0A8J7WSI9_9ACTN|nr:carbohydrate kinase family protein [Actinocrinis puniceicyclus]MBS2965667.1 carbohydrate kinase family protein [Actinocrinis puniceicyclus]
MSRVVVVGVSSLYITVPVERFPVPYEPTCRPAWTHVGVGGVGAHVARVLRALDEEVDLCTVVGDDSAGAAIRRELCRHGLDGPGVVTGPGSSLGVVLVDESGRRAGRPCLAAVDAVTYPAPTFADTVAGADLAVVTNTVFARELLPIAARLRVPVAVDVHLIGDLEDPYDRPWLQVADVLFCSHEALPCPPAEWIRRVFSRYPGCSIVAVGCGPRGCVVGTRDGALLRAAAVAPRGVVNTTGAGDALFASFLHGWLAGGNPVQALAQAVVYAGWKIGDRSPVEAQLSSAELGGLLTRHRVRITAGRWDRGAAPGPAHPGSARPHNGPPAVTGN